MRSMPSSIFTTITSMAMMASSTRRPSARMSAPSVMRSKNRPVSSMMRNTTASVSGTAAATTMPTRQPRLSRLTSSTTPSAIANFIMNSSTAAVMLTAWSLTLASVMPSGSVCAIAADLSSRALPSSRPFQPSCITTASMMVGSP